MLDNPAESLEEKIERAIRYYREKEGKDPEVRFRANMILLRLSSLLDEQLPELIKLNLERGIEA